MSYPTTQNNDVAGVWTLYIDHEFQVRTSSPFHIQKNHFRVYTSVCQNKEKNLEFRVSKNKSFVIWLFPVRCLQWKFPEWYILKERAYFLNWSTFTLAKQMLSVIISHKIFKDHLHQLCVRVSIWPAYILTLLVALLLKSKNNWEESRNNDTKWCYSMLLMFTEVFLVSVDSIVLYCNSHHDVPL